MSQSQDWQQALRTAITDLHELITILDIDPTLFTNFDIANRANQDFALRVPRGFVARMHRGDRLLMLAMHKPTVAAVMAFPIKFE